MGTASKAHAAALGGGVGAALAELIGAFSPQMADHQTALSIILSAVLAWIATYVSPTNTPPS